MSTFFLHFSGKYGISKYCRETFDGWIPEWPKGTDCKSAAICFGGSNPPPPIGVWLKETVQSTYAF